MILLLGLHLSAAVYTVSQDGTGDYTSIQPAINVSVAGDTVLVEPGRYFENLAISDGITLASLYLTTGIHDYVHSTIIDGNQTGTCLLIEETLPDTFNLTGFTVTNGNGHVYGARGGGLTIHDSAIIIMNNIIENNFGEFAGGIRVRNSSLFFSATTIRYNRGSYGGIYFKNCYSVEFDPVNLCNIYLNNGSPCDILKHIGEIPFTIELFADTLTVLNPLDADGYFICSTDNNNNILDDINIHANHGKIEPVNSDLYVSPDGDDSNSGLNPDEPLQRICTAMSMIASDSLQHNTIYLAEGLYSAEANDQHFPVGMRNWVNIEGQSMENTIIECGLEISTFKCRNSSLRLGFSIKNLQFIQNSLPDISGWGIIYIGTGYENPDDSLSLENILIQDCYTNNRFIKFGRARSREAYPYEPNTHLKNINLLNNTAGNAIVLRGNVFAENIVIQGHEQLEEGYLLGAVPIIYSGNGHFILCNSLISDCINHRIDSNYAPAAIAIEDDDILQEGPLIDIFNCTIGNNHSDASSGSGIAIGGGPTVVNFYNTIIYGNTPYEVIAIDNSSVINDFIDVNFYNTVIDAGEVLISSEVNLYYNIACNDVNPYWYNTGDLPYFLQDDSYCIDTGTLTQLDSLIAFLPETDLAGNPRIYNNQIDMGCYEWNPDAGDDEFVIENEKWKMENYPNPFNPTTTITFSTTASLHCTTTRQAEGTENTTLNIYNIKGQKIKTLVNEILPAGQHSVIWDGNDKRHNACASGIYFCRITAGSQMKTQKMLLLK